MEQQNNGVWRRVLYPGAGGGGAGSANVRVGVGVRSLPPSFIQKFEDFKVKRVLFMED